MKLSFFSVAVTVALAVLPACNCNKPCEVGQATCACRDGNQCDDGAVCSDSNICVAPKLVDIQVSDSAARGCELLVTEKPGTQVAFGKFATGVVGSYVRESPKVAVAFVAEKDSPLPGSGAQLALSAGDAAGLTVAKSSCVDAKGGKLPGAAVTIR